jgi:hypothetical protein
MKFAGKNHAGLILTNLMLLSLVGCGQHDTESSPDTPENLVGNNGSASIEPAAIEPYTRQDDSDVFAKWGKAGVTRINKLRVAAAKTVSKNPECGRVTDVQIADESHGSTRAHPVVFVDCDPIRRFYVGEADVDRPVVSQRQAGAALATIVEKLCIDATTSKLQFPSSLSIKSLSIEKDQSKATGNWGVSFDFSAQNGLGIPVPQRARCTISAQGETEVTISNR